MANFVITYDLNGPRPSHKEMDEHLRKVTTRHARILESVWWVSSAGTAEQLRDRVKTILGNEDLLLVVEANSAAWTRLLVDGKSLVDAWRQAA